MTINGVSTCTEAGTEKYERFQSGIGSTYDCQLFIRYKFHNSFI